MKCKIFLRSIFLLSYIFVNFYLFPVNASSQSLETEDQKVFITKPQTSIKESEDEIVTPVQESLMIINKSLQNKEKIESIDLVNNNRDIMKNIGEVKIKIAKISESLDVTEKNSGIPVRKREILRTIDSPESLDTFLKQKEIKVDWNKDSQGIKDSIHATLAENPSTLKVNYVGSLKAKVWDCGYCNKDSGIGNLLEIQSKEPLDFQSAKRCRSCGYDKSESNMNPSYRDVNIPYEGSINVNCKSDHHKCYCPEWAEVISSLHYTLEENEFYKNMYENHKSHLNLFKRINSDIKDINTTLSEVEEKETDVFKALNKERTDHRVLDKTIHTTAQIASVLMNDKDSYQNKIISTMTEQVQTMDEQIKKTQEDLVPLREFKAIEAKVRSTLPMLFLKLCTKADVKGEKKKLYASVLKDKQLSTLDLLDKVEEFMWDDDIQ